MAKNGNSFWRKIVNKIIGQKMVKITKYAKKRGTKGEMFDRACMGAKKE